ncbi:MAG: chloride channel protein [Candidatus Kapabacteria bacterium]|nr:chloride channel protein [Candidatus Kapabacteria bacterium]
MLKLLISKLSKSQILVFVAILIGLVTGLEAVVLKYAVHHIQVFLQEDRDFSGSVFLIAIAPMFGILLTVIFIQFVLGGKLGRGISTILYDIAQKSSFVHKNKTFSAAITAGITVGFGGSAGLEAPIVVTGAAIGSNIAAKFRFNYKERSLLLASGAAAGIGAVFNAPITGAIFAIEVLLTNVAVTGFIPIIIASACGTLLSKIILGEDILFSFTLTEDFNYVNVPFYILLGIFAGFVSLYYARMTTFIEEFAAQFKKRIYARAIIGGLLLSGLYLLFPSLFGEGYHSVKLLATGNFDQLFRQSVISSYLDNEWFFIAFIGFIMLAKVVATAITLNSGGNGGNFAPSLFVGAYLGFFFAKLAEKLNLSDLPVGNFTLVGMAGILSGVFYAPFTGVFLIAEVTGGYELILPLMIVSAVSFMIVKRFEPYSMDTKKYAKRGEILTEDKDTNILTLMHTSQLIEQDVRTIAAEATLGELVETIKESTRNIFAVLSPEGGLSGIIELDSVRDIMFKPEKYDTVKVRFLMRQPEARIYITEPMLSVMRKFDLSQSWNLPVVDATGKYVGFVSKANIFNTYRQLLKES